MSTNTNKNIQSKDLTPMITKDQYIDYDFSAIVDTRGGFLVEKSTNLDKQSINSGPTLINDIPAILNPNEALNCKECQSNNIDPGFLQIFKIQVCDNCKRKFPEKFSLLTKTEVKEDYLLTEDELRDKDLFLAWSKPNPRKSTWNNMLLYVREQVEEYAFKKYGGPEGLDAEFDRRENLKRKKKDTKFKEKLKGTCLQFSQANNKDLRKRTRTDQWQKDRKTRFQGDTSGKKAHIHDFGATRPHPDDPDKNIHSCNTCQFEIEVEIF